LLDKLSADDESVRRLIARFEAPERVWACYEAGPTGYELARVMRSAGMRCEVIAPSLIPTRPGDRVKTDRRDARRLALLFRAGQLSSVRVPTVPEEAVRDLCRARADMVIDRTRARHRLGKFLLRHGRVWRGGDNWTLKHAAWLDQQRFEEPALNETLAHYQATLSARDAAVDAIEADLWPWCDRAPFADTVHRMAAYNPRCHRARRADLRVGGVRLAPFPDRWNVYGVHRAGALRGLQRGTHPPGRHHARR
jgi:transposase